MPLTLDIIIIGAGPAGLVAAIAAARQGKSVLVCEAMARPGLKLLASGGGRCNLTNTLEPVDIMTRFGRDGRFMTSVLNLLPPCELRKFLAELGVETHHPDGFHVFPTSHNAKTVLDALLCELRKLGVQLVCNSPVTDIIVNNGAVEAVCMKGKTVRTKRVIFAAGGQGYPALGGSESGLKLAEKTGHKLVPTCPAMVPLETEENWPAACTAYTIPKVKIQVNLPKCSKIKEEGDLIFTRTGISGPVIQDLSGKVSRLLMKHQTVPLLLNLCHGGTEDHWRSELRRLEGSKNTAAVNQWLGDRGVKPPIADVYCALAGNIGDRAINQLGRRFQEQLTQVMVKTPLTVTRTAGWGKAMVTSGGVSLKDIDPRTLQSKRVQGLLFAGEMMNLDGPCGGFNLQWAFASGYLAGMNAAG